MLYLLRHGDAVEESVAGSDALRWLSARGRDETRATAEAVRGKGVVPTRILCSPLVRAVQTAELFASVVRYAGVVEIEPALVPAGGRAAALRRRIEALVPDERCVWVGHEPSLSHLSRSVLGVEQAGDFDKSEMLAFEPNGDGYALAWRCLPVPYRVR